jgi:hypothetical protein
MQINKPDMRQVFLKIAFLLIALTGVLDTAAGTTADSLLNKQVAAIQQSLIERIQQNKRLISEGKADQASYIVVDRNNPPVSFFTHFTSPEARKLWIDRGWIGELIMQNNLSSEIEAMNKWIDDLKKAYLDNTPYKDHKIYFVVSGIYNYENIDAPEADYDWDKVRPISFNKSVKDQKSSAYSPKEEKILQGILKKVQNSTYNSDIANLQRSEKFIICYMFQLYKYHRVTYTWSQAGMELSETQIKTAVASVPNTFLVTGTFYNLETVDPALITELNRYNDDHQNEDTKNVLGDITSRNDYLAQQIRNTFMFFAAKAGKGFDNADCSKNKDLVDRLYNLYRSGQPNGTTTIAESLKDLTISTRKCLLEQLSNSTFCGDGDAYILKTNLCENLVLDIVKSTPKDQRRLLLDYLGENNNDVLQRIIGKMDDAHEIGPIETKGGDNFTELVHLLSQYAYDVYQNDLALLKNGVNMCSWYSFDPTTDFNTWSKNTLADYKADNIIYFDFRRYSGLCYTTQTGPDGFTTKSFYKRPFEFVGIIPVDDLPFKFKVDGKEVTTGGKKIFVPALMLYWNIRKAATKSLEDDSNLAYDLASYFYGGAFFNIDGSKLSSVLGEISTLSDLVARLAIRNKILSEDNGDKFLKALEVVDTHLPLVSIAEEPKEIDHETAEALFDIVTYWNELIQKPNTFLDPDFGALNVPLNELEDAMKKDKLIPGNDALTRGTNVDILFSSIKKDPEYHAFRQFYVYDKTTTIEVADNSWADTVTNWRSNYGIGASRNLAIMKYGQNEFILPSGAAYSSQMERSTRFVPLSFYNDLKAGKRLFECSKASRNFDSEVIGFEYFARLHNAVKGGKYPNVKDEITIFTDLWTCSSCAGVFVQFRAMFPNVKFKIITNPKAHY